MTTDQPLKPLASDVHRHAINARTLVIRFFGTLAGIKYGAVIDLKTGHAKWDDTIEYVEPRKGGETVAKDGSAECPGCNKTLKKLLRGGMGWAKEVLNVGQAPATIAEARQSTCLACPSGCYDFGVCRDDLPDRKPEQQGCGCILALKVTQASEECPHKHWLKHHA